MQIYNKLLTIIPNKCKIMLNSFGKTNLICIFAPKQKIEKILWGKLNTDSIRNR